MATTHKRINTVDTLKINEVMKTEHLAIKSSIHTENREKTSILCHPNVETDRQGKPFRGVNKVEALIRRKYPLKYDASSDRRT
ncbi:hypothetical protein H5410_035740 [Solanum commersonii]|uniref:Uncharacterized protein n=1 Tax=Solanum commersonii TaxID=4109 RepID=A0A9J5Y5L3_SOLCO|nr:hypothetical protein H5410_035740 [Solanum commersonii]